jgi:tRNA dimethylallyltransferase
MTESIEMPAEMRAVLIAGPTASGKSRVALEIARRRGGVIINADSMQVYRELRVLTARPLPEEELEVPHRLYGCLSGAEPWSVARWLAAAKQEIAAAWQGGLLPILVGGTGLYFKALEGGLADIPPIPPVIREKWRGAAGDLHGALHRLDPDSAMRLRPGDRQRIIRALEVAEGTGKPLSFWHGQAAVDAALAGAELERLLVCPDRQQLYARADERFAAMVEGGAIEEVKDLLRLGLAPSQPIMKAIGVRELGSYIHGKTSLAEAIAAGQKATRHYIKRQFTWWRHQIEGWIDHGSDTQVNASKNSSHG